MKSKQQVQTKHDNPTAVKSWIKIFRENFEKKWVLIQSCTKSNPTNRILVKIKKIKKVERIDLNQLIVNFSNYVNKVTYFNWKNGEVTKIISNSELKKYGPMSISVKLTKDFNEFKNIEAIDKISLERISQELVKYKIRELNPILEEIK